MIFPAEFDSRFPLSGFMGPIYHIINDGSSDKSLDIINSFIDGRITVINRDNKGLIYSLNEGLNIANGNYIARMDADDIARFDRIEKQLCFLKKNKNVAIVGSYANLIDEDGNNIGLKKKPSSDTIIKAVCFFGSPFIHPSVMFNKNLIKEELYYSNNFVHAEDYELCLHAPVAPAQTAAAKDGALCCPGAGRW